MIDANHAIGNVAMFGLPDDAVSTDAAFIASDRPAHTLHCGLAGGMHWRVTCQIQLYLAV